MTIRVTGLTGVPNTSPRSISEEAALNRPSASSTKYAGLRTTWVNSSRVRARNCAQAVAAPKRGAGRGPVVMTGAGASASAASRARFVLRRGRSPKRNRL